MALYRTGAGAAITTATAVYSGTSAPTGNITISEGLSSYKYIAASAIEGVSGSYEHGGTATLVKVEDFKTTPISLTSSTGETVTATYVDDNTVSFAQASGSPHVKMVFFLLK